MNSDIKKIFLVIIIVILSLIILPVIAVNVDLIDLDNNQSDLNSTPINVNNSNCPDFVKTNQNYDISPFFNNTNGLETEKNLIQTCDGNKNYTFETEYFLPMAWKEIENGGVNHYWYNCQSIAIHGKYMYVLTSSGYNLNKGFIVRYDMDVLNKYNLSTNNLTTLREIGYDLQSNNHLTNDQKIIKKSIKVGPVFNTGHGQSLSYNSKDNSMWMWQDDGDSNSSIRLMSIDMDELKPNKTYNLSASYNGYNNKNHKIKEFRNLAFDSEGNFYTDYTKKSESNPNGSSVIFKGKVLNDTSVEIEHLGTIKKRPGTYSQSLAINPTTNRMYLVSDGVFYTVPLDKFNNKNLSKDDFHYSVFDTSREFEGVSFDSEGNSYLIILRGTEVLKSTQVYY